MKRFRGKPEKEISIVTLIGGIILYMLAVSFVLGGGIWLGLKLFG